MDSACAQVAKRWWQGMTLSESELQKNGIPAAPSSYKAQLKRADNIAGIMMTEGFRSLWQGRKASITETATTEDMECWAVIAQTLAFVKNDSDKNLARASGLSADGGKPVVSEMRFLQLNTARTPDEFSIRLRRVIQQLKGSVSVVSLINDIEQWFHEYHQKSYFKSADKISIKWAMDYYSIGYTSSKK